MPVGDLNPNNPDQIVVFESDSTEPVECTFNGQTFTCMGLVQIYGPKETP